MNKFSKQLLRGVTTNDASEPVGFVKLKKEEKKAHEKII